MIKPEKVISFKEIWSNENKIIIDLINKKINRYFIEPILDIGCGMGDIALNSLSDKQVDCLDIEDFNEYQISSKHNRIHQDFFEFIPRKNYRTALFSHSLQYLDESIDLLLKKLNQINPEFVIVVINNNNDFLGKCIDFLDNEKITHNAEVNINEFPGIQYELLHTENFTSTLKCDTMEVFITQIMYLMDMDNNIGNLKLQNFIRDNLSIPEISINQSIKVYGKQK